MSKAERNFSQLDKEALSIIASVKKFHQFLFGRNFEIRTDHKPLLGLFGEHKKMPEVISPRLLRWCLILGAYNYNLVYKPGKNISNADALSRLPVKVSDKPLPPDRDILMLECYPEELVSAREIA